MGNKENVPLCKQVEKGRAMVPIFIRKGSFLSEFKRIKIITLINCLISKQVLFFVFIR